VIARVWVGEDATRARCLYKYRFVKTPAISKKVISAIKKKNVICMVFLSGICNTGCSPVLLEWCLVFVSPHSLVVFLV